jgi:hypothetical protein
LASLAAAALTGAVCAALLLHWLLPGDAAAISSLLQSLAHEVRYAGPGSIFGLSLVFLALAGLRTIRKI